MVSALHLCAALLIQPEKSALPIPLVAGGVALFIVLIFRNTWRLRMLHARRNYVFFRVKRVAVGFTVFVASTVLFAQHGLGTGKTIIGAVGIAFVVTLTLVRPPIRSRYIPKAVRRAVIRRDLGDEKRFNSKIHAIDHRVPFSRWGDNSVDNLRVLTRTENAKKRDRMPTRKDYEQSWLPRSEVKLLTFKHRFAFVIGIALLLAAAILAKKP